MKREFGEENFLEENIFRHGADYGGIFWRVNYEREGEMIWIIIFSPDMGCGTFRKLKELA